MQLFELGRLSGNAASDFDDLESMPWCSVSGNNLYIPAGLPYSSSYKANWHYINAGDVITSSFNQVGSYGNSPSNTSWLQIADITGKGKFIGWVSPCRTGAACTWSLRVTIDGKVYERDFDTGTAVSRRIVFGAFRPATNYGLSQPAIQLPNKGAMYNERGLAFNESLKIEFKHDGRGNYSSGADYHRSPAVYSLEGKVT